MVVCLSVLSVYADMSAVVIQFGVLQFSPPAVAALFALALLNLGWIKLFKAPLLNAWEMLIVYAMMLVAVMVATRGVIEKILGSVAYLPYAVLHGNPEFKPFLAHMPAWIVPYDPAASGPSRVVAAFYEGDRGYVPWDAWVRPICLDFALAAGIVVMFLCLSVILRRQWVDVEQLNFPLTTLPVAIIQNSSDGRPLLSNSLLWLGIGVSAAIFGLNGLAANYPSVPSIPTSFNFRAAMTTPPWNSVEFLTGYVSLAVIGFAYFIPGDVLLSMWLFYLLNIGQIVTAAAFGYPSNVAGNWPGYETAGAYFALAGAMLWQSRRHLAQVWQTAFGKAPKRLDDSAEMMSYRSALIGLAVGFAAVMAWMLSAGMSFAIAFWQLAIYVFVVAFVMSRAVAQAGLLMTETSFLPQMMVGMFTPMTSLGASNLTMLSVTDTFFAQDLRGELLAPFMDTQRTAGKIGAPPRVLLAPLIVAVLIAFAAGSAAFLHLNYAIGGNQLYSHPHDVANYEMSVLLHPINGINPPESLAGRAPFVVGIVLALLLSVLRARFTWFPLHPLGLALCSAWCMKVFWLGFLIAWVVRGLIVRYGGMTLYRRIAPVMLGLVVGEFSSAVFWACLHMIDGVSAPLFPWP